MPKYLSFGPEAQITGRLIATMLESQRGAQLIPYLAQNGLENPDPNQWYPLDSLMNVFNDILADGEGAASATFVAIAMREMEAANWPPDIKTLAQALESIDGAYHMQYRGADIGSFWHEKLGPTQYRLYCQIPHPQDYVYGLLYGLAKRYLPSGTPFVVEFDEAHNGREESTEPTVLLIEW